jgi:hypothetical protein
VTTDPRTAEPDPAPVVGGGFRTGETGPSADVTATSDGDLTREELPDELSGHETVARLLQADQGYGCGEAHEAAMDRVEPDELLELSCVVARSLGTGERAVAPDDPVTNEELYRVHVRERVEPELRFGTRSTVEAAIADSDHEYGDFGGDPVTTAVIERHAGGTLTEYDERVRGVAVHLEAAVRD